MYWHNQYDEELRRYLDDFHVDHIDVVARDGQAGFWRMMLSNDGIHLTARGYQQLSRLVFSGLEELRILPSTSKVTSSKG